MTNTALESTSDLLEIAHKEWEKMLSRTDSKYFVYRRFSEIKLDDEVITLSTDECVFLFMEFAEHVGLDVERFGRQLHAEGKPGRFLVGIALRTVLEVEGYYVERPGASSRHQIPRKVLIVLGAAILGFSGARAGMVHPELGGVLGGVASLLISLLAARALDDKPRPFDFAGEFILALLDPVVPVSMASLQEQTNFHETVLTKIIADLEARGAVSRIVMAGNEIGLIRGD